MDAFTELSPRLKVLMVAFSLFLVTLSIGLLVLGDTGVGREALQEMNYGVKADLLYSTPTDLSH